MINFYALENINIEEEKLLEILKRRRYSEEQVERKELRKMSFNLYDKERNAS